MAAVKKVGQKNGEVGLLVEYLFCGLGVDFTEGGKPENPEKNPESTEETNYNNSTHMSSKLFENQHEAILRWSPIQL